MIWLRSLFLAFSCFSKIPVPQMSWKPESMRYMFCFFPLVGVVCGLLIWLWCWICSTLGFGPLLQGAGLILVPLLVTGGIHMDGFADVVDAQSSHATLEKKREILKDPHTGAFSIIGVGCYLVAYVAFASELDLTPQVIMLLAAMQPLSRILSGMTALAYPSNASQGMLSSFSGSAHRRTTFIVLAVELVAVAAFMLWAWWQAAVVVIVLAVLCAALLHPFARKQFGGMSGDLSGFFLTVAELVMLIGLAVFCKVVL